MRVASLTRAERDDRTVQADLAESEGRYAAAELMRAEVTIGAPVATDRSPGYHPDLAILAARLGLVHDEAKGLLV